MRIIVEMGHPAHVHHFKNMIWSLEEKGHNVLVCTTDKEVTLDLLNNFEFTYKVLGKNKSKGIVHNIPLLICGELKMYLIAKKFKPDVFVCRGSLFSAHISRIFRKRCISFNDTEHSSLVDSIVFPFVDVILTPSCFTKDLGNKQIRYNGYHELAYLHPNYFAPDPKVLNELGLSEKDIFIVLRFVSWGASHDLGHKTLTLEDKLNAVNEFKKYGRVLITSENKLPPELEEYRITVSPDKMHNLLYYATLLYGDSATMASECAVLGTHSIYCDYAGRGYTDEEEELYDLVYNFYDENTMGTESLKKALELLQDPNLKEKGRQRREILLADKIDVTEFMVEFVENYSKN